MTRVGDIPPATLRHRLRVGDVHLDTGAFTTALRIELPQLVEEFARMYVDYRLEDPPGIDDFRVRVASPPWRRFVRPLAQHWIDDVEYMQPLPLDQAFPCLESALNLAVATDDLTPLVVHSAVLERDGRALVIPAPSGTGKSTLCAALAWRGWRLMSDEMAVFCFERGGLRANPRPISLKNRAVEIIAAREPHARFTRVYRNTVKGDVAYMQAPPDAVARAHEGAEPGLIIVPLFREGEPLQLEAVERVDAFRWLVDNSINYASMLRTGFDLMTRFVERSRAYRIIYSDLDETIATLDRLHAGD